MFRVCQCYKIEINFQTEQNIYYMYQFGEKSKLYFTQTRRNCYTVDQYCAMGIPFPWVLHFVQYTDVLEETILVHVTI